MLPSELTWDRRLYPAAPSFRSAVRVDWRIILFMGADWTARKRSLLDEEWLNKVSEQAGRTLAESLALDKEMK
jgi:hypothetical protein